jgi:imidazole glycerol-phosphate synthase subunit HisH
LSAIAIVDYGMGNLRSVSKALESLGYETVVTRDPEVIDSAPKVVLPGVGAFGAAMDNLRKFGLVEPVVNAATSGRPFLGICLGMQLLMDTSEEQGTHTGLGVIHGTVLGFFQPWDQTPETSLLKIPNMGWCPISIRKPSPLLKDIPDQSMVYFVHSFYVQPQADVVAAQTRHGIDYCSVIWKDSIHATQFHPEKSGSIGLRMLRNFAEIQS